MSSLDRIRKQIALLWPFLQFAAHAGELDVLAVALGTVYKIARARGVAQATNRLANRILDQRRELLGPTRAASLSHLRTALARERARQSSLASSNASHLSATSYP